MNKELYAVKLYTKYSNLAKEMNNQSKDAADVLWLNGIISKWKHDRLIKKIEKKYKENK